MESPLSRSAHSPPVSRARYCVAGSGIASLTCAVSGKRDSIHHYLLEAVSETANVKCGRTETKASIHHPLWWWWWWWRRCKNSLFRASLRPATPFFLTSPIQSRMQAISRPPTCGGNRGQGEQQSTCRQAG